MTRINKSLRVGLIGEAIATVTENDTALRVGSGAFKVFATPSLIALMEAAAVSAIAPHLDDEYASVGIAVNIRHVAATPIGERVIAMAEVSRINNKHLYLEVRAWDEQELIGLGTHERYLVRIEDFRARFKR